MSTSNGVKLDEEAVEVLTSAVNLACARQFERLESKGFGPRALVSVTNENAVPYRSLPSTSGMSAVSSRQVRVEAEKPKKKISPDSDSPPPKKVREKVEDADSIKSISGLGMDEDAIIHDEE